MAYMPTPYGGWKPTVFTQDVVDSPEVTNFSPVSGHTGVYQVMKQSAAYNSDEYSTQRWYLLSANRREDGTMHNWDVFYKDSLDMPKFPASFPSWAEWDAASKGSGATTPPSSGGTTTTTPSTPSTGSGGSGTPADPKVKQLQTALNAKYSAHDNYPLVVDGRFGPKTCGACYKYQAEKLGIDNSLLGATFFKSLGLPESYAAAIGGGCTAWYAGGGIIAPDGDGKPFPWLATLIGAAGGSLIGLAGKKTVLKKAKRVKTWHAGVGGAVLGAIGGYIAGKMRQ